MKRFLILISSVIASAALASVVILFDPGTGRNLRKVDSADTLQYLGRSDALINPVLPTNDLRLCYATSGTVQVIPQAWLNAEAVSAWIANSNAVVLNQWIERSNNIYTARNVVNGTDAPSRLMRWQTLLVLHQINELRKMHSLGVISTNTLVNALSNAVVNDAL